MMDLHFTFSVSDEAQGRRVTQQLAAWAAQKNVLITKGKIDTKKAIGFSSHKDVANFGVDQVKRAEIKEKRNIFIQKRIEKLPTDKLRKLLNRKGIATSEKDGKTILLTKLTRSLDKKII